MIHHQPDKLLKSGLCGIPAKLVPRLRRIAKKIHNVCRTVEIGTNLHKNPSRFLFNAFLVNAFSPPFKLDSGIMKGKCRKFTHGMLLACRYNIIVGLLILQNKPHAFHIILRVAPVAQRREIAEIQSVLQAVGDSRGGKRDLPRDKRLATTLGFVIEQNSAAAEHIVSLAVFLGYPEAVLLGDSIG